MDYIAGFFKADGTVPLTGAMNAGTKRVTNIANGTDAHDAVNLSQLNLELGQLKYITNMQQRNRQLKLKPLKMKLRLLMQLTRPDSAATSAATAANLASRSIFVGFQRLVTQPCVWSIMKQMILLFTKQKISSKMELVMPIFWRRCIIH